MRTTMLCAGMLALLVAGCAGPPPGDPDPTEVTVPDAQDATDDREQTDPPAPGAPEDPPAPGTPEDPPGVREPMDPPPGLEPTEPPHGDLAAARAAAVTDAAAAAGVDPDEVVVVVAEEVVWSDGSLGCPEPGMMYTQALVPGVRIVVEVAGTQRAYHGAAGQLPSYCPDPQPPAGP